MCGMQERAARFLSDPLGCIDGTAIIRACMDGGVFRRTQDSRNVVMFLLENLSVSCYRLCKMKIQSVGEQGPFEILCALPASENLYGQSSHCGRRPPGVEGGHD
jgi:hypothetical protein